MKRLAVVLGCVALAALFSLRLSTPTSDAGPITPTGWRPPTCGSGSGIAATGSGLAYQCARISSGSGTTNTVPKWTNGSGAIGDSSITDNGSTVLTSENLEAQDIQADADALIEGEITGESGASISGGAVNINTTGTDATSIGNLSGNLALTGNATTISGSGNTTIDPAGELILDGEFSTVLKAGSGSASIYLEGVLQTTNTGVTAPTISGGTCASNICTNTGGTISLTSNPATLTFTSGFYAHAPICTLGGVPKTASVVISFSSAPSTTSFAVQESTFNSGDKVSYICIGAG